MCPKCRSNNTWEDNFWSGCNRCGWTSSCQSSVLLISNRNNYSHSQSSSYDENDYCDFNHFKYDDDE